MNTNVHWYILQTISKQENTARTQIHEKSKLMNLDSFVHQVVVPEENVESMKNGKKCTTKRSIYPGYIFIEMEQNENVWHMLNSISALKPYLKRTGAKLSRVSVKEMNEIFDRMKATEEKPIQKIEYLPEEKVRIKTQAFLNFEATVKTVNYMQQTLTVDVLIFGRPTPLQLTFNDIEKL